MKTLLLSLIILTTIAGISLAQENPLAPNVPPPPGWRYPVESDYVGPWQDYRKLIPVPYHFTADLNSDGTMDDAWILIRTDKPLWWGLFVFIGTDSQPVELQLTEGNRHPQLWSIQPAPPGKYTVMEDDNQERVLLLKAPGINLFVHEGPNLFFYWDGKEFKKSRVMQPPEH
jgi:hypothetical protein